MPGTIHVIGGPGNDEGRVVSPDALPEIARGQESSVLYVAPNRSVARIYARLARHMTGLIQRRQQARQDKRIEDMVDALLDIDPFDRVEAEIDADNAEMRGAFLQEFEMLDSAAVHDRAGHAGRNKAQTAAAWKRAGKVLALSHHGRALYPAFQFDADGRPLPLVAEVLAAMPGDLTPWQRAFWLAAPCEALDGATPLALLRAGDRRVIEAAALAGAVPVG